MSTPSRISTSACENFPFPFFFIYASVCFLSSAQGNCASEGRWTPAVKSTCWRHSSLNLAPKRLFLENDIVSLLSRRVVSPLCEELCWKRLLIVARLEGRSQRRVLNSIRVGDTIKKTEEGKECKECTDIFNEQPILADLVLLACGTPRALSRLSAR